ncbi:hypothetical protein ACFQ23_04395 [Schaalia naturae]|jgi:predicted nucleic acid-binding protein|uniref:PIN domain-containing protein n=1 Tax=Schaalia naturae TaxID=635203 RepID=A0ABW2SPH3_9ACTO
MAPSVRFVDTSVLCNILRVPGRDQDHEAVLCQLSTLHQEKASLLIPAAAVVETGNHISHVHNGHERREAAARFEWTLRQTIENTAPWQLNDARWGAVFLADLCDGCGTGAPLTQRVTTNDVGVGDLTILAEAAQYRARSQLSDVRIWTTDSRLDAYNPA